MKLPEFSLIVAAAGHQGGIFVCFCPYEYFDHPSTRTQAITPQPMLRGAINFCLPKTVMIPFKFSAIMTTFRKAEVDIPSYYPSPHPLPFTPSSQPPSLWPLTPGQAITPQPRQFPRPPPRPFPHLSHSPHLDHDPPPPATRGFPDLELVVDQNFLLPSSNNVNFNVPREMPHGR